MLRSTNPCPNRGDKPGAYSLMACNLMYIQGEAALVPLPRREAALPAGQRTPAQQVPQHPNPRDARALRGSRMHAVTPSCISLVLVVNMGLHSLRTVTGGPQETAAQRQAHHEGAGKGPPSRASGLSPHVVEAVTYGLWEKAVAVYERGYAPKRHDVRM